MAGVADCPSCGESEELRGEPVDDDIRVTCLRCRAQWMRGGPRCAGCGGTDIVHRPQAMTRHSRGTQLSIIGWRELPLCRVCDAEALQTSIAENVPVPSDYVAVCLYGAGPEPVTRATPATEEMPPPPVMPAREPVASAEPKRAVEGAPRPRSRSGRPKTTPTAPPSMVPTVRQAISAFLTEASEQADATAMLLLGTHLGSHNRLSVLETDGAARELAAWCNGHWADGSDRSRRAVGTICRAVDFWGARGWLVTDPAAGLR